MNVKSKQTDGHEQDLNEFNIHESLDVGCLSDTGSSGSGRITGKKKRLPAVILGTIAAAVTIITVTAVALNPGDPNAYDMNDSKFVTDSDSVSIDSIDDGVIGMGVIYQASAVYDSASSEASVIATLVSGTNVMIYDVSGDYYKISNSQKTVKGYVHREDVNTGGIEIVVSEQANDVATEQSTSESSTKKNNTASKSKSSSNNKNSSVNPEDFPVNSSPYFIYVEKGSHTITIYTKDSNGKYTVPSATYSTATGRTSSLTPVGDFSILAKEKWHSWGNTSYSPYCSKYSNGLYFHGPLYLEKDNFYSLSKNSVYDIGKNATSGCMRTSVAAAYAVYNCPVGTGVKIVNGSPLNRSASAPSVDSQYTDPSKKNVALKGISFEPNEKSVEIGDSVTINPKFNPENASDMRCTWSVSDNSVATLKESEYGISCTVTAKKAGTTVITAKSLDGGYTAKFTLTVKAAATSKPAEPTTEPEPGTTDPDVGTTDPSDAATDHDVDSNTEATEPTPDKSEENDGSNA